MGRIESACAAHPLVGFDTAACIDEIEGHTRFGASAGETLDLVARGQAAAVTSVVTLAETLVRPMRAGRLDLANAYQTLLWQHPSQAVAALTVPVARTAAER